MTCKPLTHPPKWVLLLTVSAHINHLLFMHLVIKSYIRKDEKQRKNLRRENIRIISHYVLTRWKENKTFRSPFFFVLFSDELKTGPVWLEWQEKENIPLSMGTSSTLSWHEMFQQQVIQTITSKTWSWHIGYSCHKPYPKNDLTSPVSDVYK